MNQEQLQEMWNWYQQRKAQFLPYPLDPLSKASLDVITSDGAGSAALTQNLSANLVSGNVPNAPAAYQGTILLKIGGITYEIGYIRTV